ncbi:F-box domain-containing protein [Mycena sanguinolenta]|uniref:F-box domain-containing protein n=1 Tax=Mycena sanguinolenta TaxID=230812 RepID=A0A8H6Y3E5_9AGAR|nr:F-box domain-containing protein [Mycena sanguinolenta]
MSCSRSCSFCDISTVLVVSAINEALRRIALSKQLWLSLVLDTRFRDALELPPPDREKLQCLSAEELIAVVKNAVAGLGSLWDSKHDESSVTMTRFQVPLNDMEYLPTAHLLPGARYILLQGTSTTPQRLYIYDVWSAQRVWQRSVQTAHNRKVCRVDLAPGSAIARVFFVQTVDHPNACDSTLHVEEVDLITGVSHELLNFSLDGMVSRVKPFDIAGDFLLAVAEHSRSFDAMPMLLLINWRASTFLSLNRNERVFEQLIPGYIVSTYQETSLSRAHVLAVTPLEAFSDRWQPLTGIHTVLAAQIEAGSAPDTISNQNISTQERLEYNHLPLKPNSVTAKPDALHAGAYNISVYGPQFSGPPPRPVTPVGRIGTPITMPARREKVSPEPALLSYRFTPAQGQAGSRLRLISARGVFDSLQIYSPQV